MLDCLGYVREYVAACTRDAFLDSREKQSVVIHNLMVIGEGARRIAGRDSGPGLEAFKARHAELWDILVLAGDMRNLLIHEYFGVDPLVVWNTATVFLPRLETLLAAAGPAMAELE